MTSLLLDLEGNVVDRLVTDAGGAAAGEALAMVDRWTASAGLPSSTFVAGPFAPGARATDGTAGLVTNVEGDAVRVISVSARLPGAEQVLRLQEDEAWT